MKSLFAACLAFGLTALPALAENKEADANIAGMWVFVANIDPACTFTGQATLTPQADGRNYTCEITARQSCPALDVHYVVHQSCIATRMGQQISVRSTIEEFIEGPPSASYYPDNFSLFVQDSSRMSGALISGNSPNQAVWTRPDGSIS